jgi:hypothetical protein
MISAIIHQSPVFFIEYRGWGQEVHVYHAEQPGEDEFRFRAVGRHTAFDKEGTITYYGETPQDAVDGVRRELEDAHWQTHYKSINDELLYLRSEIERLTNKPPEPTKDNA